MAIFTVDKNLVQKSLTSEQVMRWRLCVAEFSQKSLCLKGVDNHATKAISRLPMTASETSDELKTMTPTIMNHIQLQITIPTDSK